MIKKWMPSLVLIEPVEWKDKLAEELELYLNKMTNSDKKDQYSMLCLKIVSYHYLRFYLRKDFICQFPLTVRNFSYYAKN